MNYPQGKKFAFTIIDDTDNDVIINTRPVYDYLTKLGMKTTKTVWVYPSRDRFKGLSLANYRYRQYVNKLRRDGFEIALHGVGSGKFTRNQIIKGLKTFRSLIGRFPNIHINHSQNPDNIYWGIKRFSFLKPFWQFGRFQGDCPSSSYFWGDYHKKYIRYSRNLTFKNLNTLKVDPHTPYLDPSKDKYANYWFSSSDGSNLEKFLRLTSKKNVDRLSKEGGVAIIYTHFASGFVTKGQLNRAFQLNLNYLASKDGWFVSASELLDFLQKKQSDKISKFDKFKLELRWFFDKL